MVQPSQSFVPIKEIRDGVVVLNDNSLRMVLMVSSQNLALKSEEEQKAVLAQFQNFLNSLDFSVQISVKSRTLDIRPYIALLEERQKAQTSDLMKIQVTEYIDFIQKFTESVNIMTKSFFVIVPYTPPIVGESEGVTGLFKRLFPSGTKEEKGEKRIKAFEENRAQLEQRVAVVKSGLASSGVRVAPLGTEELVELYYKIFNPGEMEKPIPSEAAERGAGEERT